jgi:hypothetical protein
MHNPISRNADACDILSEPLGTDANDVSAPKHDARNKRDHQSSERSVFFRKVKELAEEINDR